MGDQSTMADTYHRRSVAIDDHDGHDHDDHDDHDHGGHDHGGHDHAHDFRGASRKNLLIALSLIST